MKCTAVHALMYMVIWIAHTSARTKFTHIIQISVLCIFAKILPALSYPNLAHYVSHNTLVHRKTFRSIVSLYLGFWILESPCDYTLSHSSPLKLLVIIIKYQISATQYKYKVSSINLSELCLLKSVSCIYKCQHNRQTSLRSQQLPHKHF